MISEDLRCFAEDPAAYGEIDPASGLERIVNDRYCLLLGPVPSFTQVSRLRLEPETVAETIAEVRALVAERGHRATEWHVSSSSTPADLLDCLVTHGLRHEAHHAVLVLADEPPAAEVEARRIQDREEFALAAQIAHEVFATPQDQRDEWNAIADERFDAERSGRGPRSYLAFVDGRAVGAAASVVEDGLPGALLIGGSVVPEFRGRGVYRALVRARWDDAVAAGSPALCVHAGPMSRPILLGLGFEQVAEQDHLEDPSC